MNSTIGFARLKTYLFSGVIQTKFPAKKKLTSMLIVELNGECVHKSKAGESRSVYAGV